LVFRAENSGWLRPAKGKRETTMIISMKLHSRREEIDEVCAIVKHFG